MQVCVKKYLRNIYRNNEILVTSEFNLEKLSITRPYTGTIIRRNLFFGAVGGVVRKPGDSVEH